MCVKTTEDLVITECSITNFGIQIKNTREQLLKQKWTRPIDKIETFHSAYWVQFAATFIFQ